MLQLIDRIAAPHLALRGPRRSIRLRLTIVYASLLLASGAALLAVTYVLVARATGDVPIATRRDSSLALGSDKTPSGRARPAEGTKLESVGPGGNASSQRLTPQQAEAQLRRDAALAKRRHDAELHQLLEHSGIALAIMAALSIPLGWLATARVLRPIRTITERAHAISATNLHRRLALALHGPDDELKHLATTFDELLDRLEASFTAQRQFAANASHELRAPLTRTRTLAEIALGDPDATVDSLRASHERVLAAGKQQERLIEALLTLARSERGLDERNPFDLAAVTATTLHARHEEAQRRRLYVHATLEPAATSGNPRLVEQLVANLLDNALRYNQPHGHIDVTTTTRSGRAMLSVANTGPTVPQDKVERLFRPFQRLGTNHTDHSNGVGLGLSIVRAIATAHDATIASHAQPHGGLAIDVSFPAPTTSANNSATPAARREGLSDERCNYVRHG